MTALDVPPTRAPDELPRGRGDGIGRLARRTQRGQGGRRTLVVVLIALAVGLGVLGGAWTSTLARADVENLLQDRFGAAELVLEDQVDGGGGDLTVPLTPEQRAWLAAHPGPDPFVEGFVEGTDVAAGEGVVVASTIDDLVALLPPGSEVLRYRHDGLWGFGSPTLLTDLDVTSSLARGTFDTGGRTTPLMGEQALASPAWLRSKGAEVGEVVEVSGVGRVEVVGTLTRAAARSSEVLVVAPGRAIVRGGVVEAARVVVPDGELDATVGALRDANRAAAEEVADGRPEWQVMVPAVELAQEYLDGQEDPTSVATLVGTVVSGFAVTVAALVAACAFAVGVRRRLRQLGMLGAVGAAPQQLARLVRREGLAIGLLGSLGGLGLGVLLALAGGPVLERLVDRDVVVSLPLVAVLPPVLLGGLAAMLAAWWPARTAARVPVVAALAGRVPTGRVPVWLPLASAVVAAAGVGLFVWTLRSDSAYGVWDQSLPLLGASIVATLGVAGLGLPVLALGGRLADRLPVLPRLALRDAARRRSRSGAAVAALVPVLALPVAGAAVALADDAVIEDGGAVWLHSEPPPSTVAVIGGPFTMVRQVPPAAEDVQAMLATLPTDGPHADLVDLGDADGWHALVTWSDDPVVAGGELGGYVPGTSIGLLTPEVREVLDLPAGVIGDGEVLLLSRALYDVPPVDGSTVTVEVGGGLPGEGGLAELPVTVRDDVDGPATLAAFVTPATASDLGLGEVGRSVLVALERPLTDDELQATWITGGDRISVVTTAEPAFWDTAAGRRLIAALTALGVLAVVCVVAGMTSALAATESDDDLRRAVALGAEPRTRRWFHGVQAWWHAAVAGVLGTGLGLVVGRAVLAETEYLQFDDTVWVLALGWALLAPVAVGVVIALAVRSSPVEAPRRRMA